MNPRYAAVAARATEAAVQLDLSPEECAAEVIAVD